jgi:hypothetical protein
VLSIPACRSAAVNSIVTLADRGDPRGPKIAYILPRLGDDWSGVWRLFGIKPEHAAYLRKFCETRRMQRDPKNALLLPDPIREAVGVPIGEEAGYFVGGRGPAGQNEDDSIINYNRPPKGQLDLWCQWTVNEAGTAILWSGVEKFYLYVEWLEYLIAHFLKPWGYIINGVVRWQGEFEEDRGILTVYNNQVTAEPEM